MKLRAFTTIFLVVAFVVFSSATDKGKSNSAAVGYVFEDEIVLPVTPVKDQYRSNTCWSFSGLSFLEAEMLRLGKPEVDLSEMYIVRYTYSEKAERYIRMHGNHNFSAGGAFHDVTNVINRFGIVPESVYRGLENGASKHMHDEMDNILKQQVDEIINDSKIKQSKVCGEAISATLNKYLGEVPQSFEYEGKSYTPQTFAAEYIGLNMDDYIEVTSYTHHPFYTKFILEVPDNWSWDHVYNVPVNELEEIIDYSLNNGFTVAWAADVSEKGFATSNKGVAVLPGAPAVEMTEEEIRKWESLPEKEKQKELYKLDRPVVEKKVTQEMRQIAFDSYETTDDHGMHIVGTAKNQEGKVFYKVKNSWGDYNLYNGFFYASKPYVNCKTMSVMVHKDGVPQHIKEKLKL